MFNETTKKFESKAVTSEEQIQFLRERLSDEMETSRRLRIIIEEQKQYCRVVTSPFIPAECDLLLENLPKVSYQENPELNGFVQNLRQKLCDLWSISKENSEKKTCYDEFPNLHL